MYIWPFTATCQLPNLGTTRFSIRRTVLYLVANVVEVRVGWHSVAMLELAGWLATLVLVAARAGGRP